MPWWQIALVSWAAFIAGFVIGAGYVAVVQDHRSSHSANDYEGI